MKMAVTVEDIIHMVYTAAIKKVDSDLKEVLENTKEKLRHDLEDEVYESFKARLAKDLSLITNQSSSEAKSSGVGE